MNPEVQGDLDVTNTCRVKNLQNYQLVENSWKKIRKHLNDSMNFQGTKIVSKIHEMINKENFKNKEAV